MLLKLSAVSDFKSFLQLYSVSMEVRLVHPGWSDGANCVQWVIAGHASSLLLLFDLAVLLTVLVAWVHRFGTLYLCSCSLCLVTIAEFGNIVSLGLCLKVLVFHLFLLRFYRKGYRPCFYSSFHFDE